eukprot:gene3389-3714_t
MAQQPGEDFPLLCETCLGSNPFVRMEKLPPSDKLCTISKLAYQGFRWKAGPNGRFKQTVISYVVAAEKHICQCCLKDLRYNLPVGVRDGILKKGDQSELVQPTSIVGQQHYYQQRQLEQRDDPSLAHPDAPVSAETRKLDRFSAIQQAKHKSPTPFANLPKLCTFWLNGRCNRGNRCPYRPCCGVFVFPEIASNHEIYSNLIKRLEDEGPIAVQKSLDQETRTAIYDASKGNREDSIRQRVAGDDILTKKYLHRIHEKPTLAPPADPSITTLWIGNLPDETTEEALQNALWTSGPPYQSIRLIQSSHFAFVDYGDRSQAELAAQQLPGTLDVLGKPVTVRWANPRNSDGEPNSSSVSGAANIVSSVLPAPPGYEQAPLAAYALTHLPLPVSEKKSKKRPKEVSLESLEDDEDDHYDPSNPWANEKSIPAKRPYYSSMNPHRLGTQY